MNAPLTVTPEIRSRERLALSCNLTDFDRFPVASLLKATLPGHYRQCVELQQSARQWAEQHVRPFAGEWDRIIGENHNFVPWHAIDASIPHGFFALHIPRILGGGGYGTLPAAVFYEEVAAADAGLSVVLGAHGLALALVMSTLDLRLIHFLASEISEGQRQGKATIFALAHTEPAGGSDVEDDEDINIASVQSTFKPVPGGYRINARKVFISNGNIARYFVLTAYGDKHSPGATARMFIIPAGAEGLSVGRVEHKMGQRLSGAAEIIADDVFVPEHMSHASGPRNIDTVLSLTRGPVGAISTGIIRGVLERVLAYLEQKRVGDHWLFDEQWVKIALAEILADLQTGRGLYMDSGIVDEYRGIAGFLTRMDMGLPDVARRNPLFRQLLGMPVVSRPLQRLFDLKVDKRELQSQVGHSSLAKFRTSDLAVRAAMRGMEILGEDANDPRWGVEKYLRDGKLCQIFEGTNQINQLHVVRGFIERANGKT